MGVWSSSVKIKEGKKGVEYAPLSVSVHYYFNYSYVCIVNVYMHIKSLRIAIIEQKVVVKK